MMKDCALIKFSGPAGPSVDVGNFTVEVELPDGSVLPLAGVSAIQWRGACGETSRVAVELVHYRMAVNGRGFPPMDEKPSP